jgi:hypothetical protein
MHLGRIRIADPPEIEPVSVDLQGIMSASGSSAVEHHALHTWWLAIMTMRSGNENSTRPSSVLRIWSATEASPLIRMVVGPHHWVKVVMNRANDCFVSAM